MSLRLEVSGFSLNKLMSLSGSHDKVALQMLSLAARDRFGTEAQNTLLETILETAIKSGFMVANTNVEGLVHVTAARMLADYDQKHLGTDSTSWQVTSLRELAAEPPEKTTAPLLQYLAYGRPLFGKKIEAEPQCYAYLSRAEIEVLRRHLPAPAPYEVRDPVSDDGKGFVDIEQTDSFPLALATWLKALDEKQMDLWLFQSEPVQNASGDRGSNSHPGATGQPGTTNQPGSSNNQGTTNNQQEVDDGILPFRGFEGNQPFRVFDTEW